MTFSLEITTQARNTGAPHDASPNGHSNGYPDVNTSKTLTGELSAQDREVLQLESAVSLDAIAARGYWTCHDPAQLKRLGFAPRQCLAPALVIPLHNWRGEIAGHVMRPQIPRNDARGKVIKYETPKDAAIVIDVAPLTRDQITDAAKPLIITEGAKKADAAASRGLCTINLSGVWNFLKDGTPHPDLNEITLQKRAVFIIFDSDVLMKTSVEKAMRRLVVTLQNRGAVVKVVYLRDGPHGEKTGLDDFFVRGGTVADLFALARDIEPVEVRKARQIGAAQNLPDTDGATFPDLPADKIPQPNLTNETGRREFDGRQIVEILRADWKVAGLTTHAAHAVRISTHMAGDVVFCPSLGWLFWNGRHWEIDDRTSTATAARVVYLSRVVRAEAAALYRHVATLASANRVSDAAALSKVAGELLRHARQAESKHFIDGALYLAAGEMRLPVSSFDQKAWRIGFANGTWDAGHWREHRREDCCLNLSPVTIDFGADRSEWLALLNRMTGGDTDYAITLQDVAAYTLSGASHLRLLLWLYGPGGTGKSTFTELLQTVLGDMAAIIDPKKLQDNAARERLGADLWNRRLAVVAEAGSQRLESEMLKTLSGGDSLTVRLLYKEQFKAPPCHLLLMVANDPPRVDAYDEALRDRVVALPFTHPLGSPDALNLTGGRRIEAVRRDPNSPLVRGFVAWALEGLARLYQTQEIHRAACVEEATARFWAETDPLTPFWEGVPGSELFNGIQKSELRRRYEDWCGHEGARPIAARQWTRACVSFGLKDDKRRGGERFWFLPRRNVAEVAKQTCFSENSISEQKEDLGFSENSPCFATSATNCKATADTEAF